MKKLIILTAFLVISLFTAQEAAGRDSNLLPPRLQTATSEDPAYQTAQHKIGNMPLVVSNNATLGIGWAASETDWLTGDDLLTSCEYPKNSGIDYLYGVALWVGYVSGRDTLVSTGADGWSGIGAEFRPAWEGLGDMIYRSTLDPRVPELFVGAISEEDYIATYADTAEYIDVQGWDGLPHRPIDIEVTQSSYAWSNAYAEDFVLIDYKIENIGTDTLAEVYVGLYVDGDVGYRDLDGYYSDDIAGLVWNHTFSYQNSCDYGSTIDLAWIADNDGDPDGDSFGPESSTSVTGICPLRYPGDISFNWWTSNSDPSLDFGPREQPFSGIWEEDYRDFGTGGLGTPEGDRNKFYLLRNREVDYDQIYTGFVPDINSIWMYPDQAVAGDIARGGDAKYLISFGPISDLQPGDYESFTVAYVGGEHVHIDPTNIDNLHDNPDAYYNNLDFTDIMNNARYASWVFDNPGIDTDGDGYSGKTFVCGNDTIWVEGDGVPDFRARVAPQAPHKWLERIPDGGLRITWNGLESETARDVFMQTTDFEGYNIYLSNRGDYGSYCLVAVYDRDDYWRYEGDSSSGQWQITSDPFTIDSLRCLYGSSCDDESFDPLDFTSNSPLSLFGGDSLFYFEPCGYNASEFGVSTPIIKTYPEQPYPGTLNPALADSSELTTDGFLKYFEYEITIKDLNPDVCYYAAVTAFDFGSRINAVWPLESSVHDDPLCACTDDGVRYRPLPNSIVLDQNYPNPFNPETEIGYFLQEASNVQLEVFNIMGQKVATLVDRRVNAGYHSVTWNGGSAASGVYLYRLSAGNRAESKKMILIK